MKIRENKVFLGGTTCGTKWRSELIPLLEIPYFNPVVPDWTPECIEEEFRQKEICKYQVYTFTPKMRGVFSIAELVESTHTEGVTTFLCILYEDEGKKFSEGDRRSMNAVKELVKKNNAVICDSIPELAKAINETASKKTSDHMICTLYAEYEFDDVYLDEDGYLTLDIEIETGKVLFEGRPFNRKGVFLKLCDGFECTVELSDGRTFEYEGYCPECLATESKGWGDYIDFVTDENGCIMKWNKTDCKDWILKNIINK